MASSSTKYILKREVLVRSIVVIFSIINTYYCRRYLLFYDFGLFLRRSYTNASVTTFLIVVHCRRPIGSLCATVPNIMEKVVFFNTLFVLFYFCFFIFLCPIIVLLSSGCDHTEWLFWQKWIYLQTFKLY